LSVAIAVIQNAPRLSTFRKCPCKEVSLIRLALGKCISSHANTRERKKVWE
jgi:hypothetical protein